MENNQENEVCDYSGLSDFTGMKKRKKKVKFNLDEIDSNKSTTTETPLAPINCNEIPAGETDLSFDLLKKKKKKKVNAHDLSNISENDTKVENDKSSGVSDIWNKDLTADYEYEDLLSRVYNIMRQKDPSIDLQTKKKLVMKPPQVIRIGTKKSSFINFIDICKMLHRTPQHLQSFLLVELGTSGSIDGSNQLIIKGRFEQKQIETVLRHYIKEYVTCHTCRSPDTFLQKDTRLFFLQCESCGSRCSVANIKSGFQAVTSKRAAMRAKAN